jgi:GNAT superfamily N-acetyltransferase
MPIRLNKLETARFGVVCAHVVDIDAPLDAIDKAARSQDVAMLTARLDTAHLGRVHELESAGFRLMDTLVYFSCRLQNDDVPVAHPGGVTIRLAEPSDAPAVMQVAREAFRDYIGHFHSDPRLDSAAADDVYVEWAQTSIERSSMDTPALVVCKDGEIAGFLTLRLNDAREAEIVLNGVHPRHQRGGVYGLLVSQAKRLAQSLGRSEVIVSTQVNNVGAQRVWVRDGFAPQRSLYTLHKWYTA